MSNITRADLEGRRIVLLGSVESVSLDSAAAGTTTVLFVTGNIVNPAAEPSIVVAFLTFEWPVADGVAPALTLFDVDGGLWNTNLDLHDLAAGGGAFVPFDQTPSYAQGVSFGVTYVSGPGSTILPTVSAFGWAA